MVAPAEPRVAPDTATVYAVEELALRKLAGLLDSEHQEVVLKAAEVIAKCAAERRRNETRLAVEQMRAETARAKVAARRAENADEDDDPYARMDPEAKRALEAEWKDTLDAWNPLTLRPEVYLWGGQGTLGRGARPDDTDTRVRLVRDDTAGVNDPLFWVVPDDRADAVLAQEPTLR